MQKRPQKIIKIYLIFASIFLENRVKNMNFLKIAVDSSIQNADFDSWQTTSLTDAQASELAAIVISDNNSNSS